jgi:hypothetical protein
VVSDHQADEELRCSVLPRGHETRAVPKDLKTLLLDRLNNVQRTMLLTKLMTRNDMDCDTEYHSVDLKAE